MYYNSFKYLYPPRPEFKTCPKELDKYDNGEYYAQPKYNGTCCIVFTNGDELRVYNRHKREMKYSHAINFRKLAKSPSWYVYAGEYLNKGKAGETGKKERDKFVIWDVLVWDGNYLTGTSLHERLDLLENIYPCSRAMIRGKEMEIYEHLCCTEIDGIYKAPTYTVYFEPLYRDIAKTDLYEGLVIKKIDSKLQPGFHELNNTDWQIKCRKETKIYNF